MDLRTSPNSPQSQPQVKTCTIDEWCALARYQGIDRPYTLLALTLQPMVKITKEVK